jgi:DNA-binding MarR family transcriptional regulator
MGDLAAGLILSKSGVTRLVAKLEQAGLLERRVPAENRRVTLATLTRAGERVLQVAIPAFERALADSFSRHLTERDVVALSRIARKLVGASGRTQLLTNVTPHLVAVDH